jgi:hypothetical protein
VDSAIFEHQDAEAEIGKLGDANNVAMHCRGYEDIGKITG